MKNQKNLWNLKTCSLRSPCPKCGNDKGNIYHSGNNYHVGKIHCSECNRFLKWVSRSEFDRARKMGIVN